MESAFFGGGQRVYVDFARDSDAAISLFKSPGFNGWDLLSVDTRFIWFFFEMATDAVLNALLAIARDSSGDTSHAVLSSCASHRRRAGFCASRDGCADWSKIHTVGIGNLPAPSLEGELRYIFVGQALIEIAFAHASH